jgi:hypothetical protein
VLVEADVEGDAAPQVTGPSGTLAQRVGQTHRRVERTRAWHRLAGEELAAYRSRITATKR